MANFIDEPAGYEEKWQLTTKRLRTLYKTLQCFHTLLIATAKQQNKKKNSKNIQINRIEIATVHCKMCVVCSIKQFNNLLSTLIGQIFEMPKEEIPHQSRTKAHRYAPQEEHNYSSRFK